jgi:4'-phosphopantetheinyl transferase
LEHNDGITMPLEKIEKHQEYCRGLWKITENEVELKTLLPNEIIPDTITHLNKRLEFITGRILAKLLIEQLGLAYHGIVKDAHGKPFFKNHAIHLSLSHSFPLVAAIIHTQKSAGIDVEQIKPKLLKIAPRILNPEELSDAGNDLTKHCVYWCAKETLVKVYGKKDLVFATDLEVEPFRLESCSAIKGKILKDGTKTTIPLYYQTFKDFVVVFNT